MSQGSWKKRQLTVVAMQICPVEKNKVERESWAGPSCNWKYSTKTYELLFVCIQKGLLSSNDIAPAVLVVLSPLSNKMQTNKKL